jgi:uncharacterized protein YndB with AHSA1/START domain
VALASYTVVRRFAASPQRVFRAFTQPEELAAWAWGDGAKDPVARVDARPGGSIEVTVEGTAPWKGRTRTGMRGVYVEVRPGRRLVHTVHWDADVGYNRAGSDVADEVVVVDIEPDGAGSRLTYSHHGIPDDGRSAGAHEGAVRATLDVLDRLLAARP